MTVTVKRVGGSLSLVIPKAVAAEAGLTEGTALDVSVTPAGVVLRKVGRRPRRPIGQIVAAIDPKAYERRNADISADRPVGKEIG